MRQWRAVYLRADREQKTRGEAIRDKLFPREVFTSSETFPPLTSSPLSSQIPETALLLKSKHLNHDPMEHASH